MSTPRFSVSPTLVSAPPAPGAVPESHVVRVADGELHVAARDGVSVSSEADRLVLTAATEIVLSVGRSSLTLRADGTILLNGERTTLNAPARIDLNPDAPVSSDGDGRPCGCGSGADG